MGECNETGHGDEIERWDGHGRRRSGNSSKPTSETRGLWVTGYRWSSGSRRSAVLAILLLLSTVMGSEMASNRDEGGLREVGV